jgi:hypothetical protein
MLPDVKTVTAELRPETRETEPMHNKILRSTTLLLAILAFATGTTFASATAYVVHGIPGSDLGLDADLPVDVNVSGVGCAIQDFRFGDRVGPIELPAGAYDITVSLADSMNPCEGAAVIGLEGVELTDGVNGTIIAHRTFDGSAGPGDLLGIGVTASIFGNDFSSVRPGNARLIAHHAAMAPTVDVVVRRDYEDMSSPGVTVGGFNNPTSTDEALLSQINAGFRPGQWDVALELGGATVFGPDALKLDNRSATYVYAVGVFPESFQYLVYVEDLRERRGNDDDEASDDDAARSEDRTRGGRGLRVGAFRR